MSGLEVRGLSAGYGAGSVVRDVDLRVEAGEVVCVLGPNGAGKTTLLRALSASCPASTGEVSLDGARIDGLGTHRRARLGLVHVPEGRTNVIGTLSVSDNLRLAAGRTGSERIAEAVALFDILRERASQRASTLSGGQQQMLAIALGIVLGPRVLLVDEPSAGLAPSVADEVFDRLATLRERGLGVLVTEQRLDLAFRVADRGYVLETGRRVLEGDVSELRDSALVRESYLGG